MSTITTRFLWTLVWLSVLILAGTAGYVAIEGRPLGDALYMTVTTVTAVGYEEVWPLSAQGRAFTVAVLLGGISWMGFWFATLTAFIVELDLGGALRRRRAMQEISSMKNHVVICGAGRTGRQVAQELASAGQPLVVIERDPKRIEQLREYVPDARVIEGDATHDQILLDAGLAEASGLIACLSADTDNLFVCLSARDLAAKPVIVARAYEEESIDKLHRAGADHVVSPNVSSAIRMASVLLRPAVVSFVDLASRASDLGLRIEQTKVTAASRIAGRTLAESRIPQETGLIVIAIGKQSEPGLDFVFNPSAETRVQPGDEVIVLGRGDQIEKLRDYLG